MEYLDVFTKFGEPTGESIDRNIAHENGMFHKSIHVWIVNSKGELLVQRRNSNKKTYPNMLDTSFAFYIPVYENMPEDPTPYPAGDTAKFVEDTSEEGKYRLEITDAKVSDKAPPSIDYLFKQLRASTGYKGNIHVIAYPAYGASAQEITDRVEDLARKGFIADILCVDYGDITKPMGGGSEVRNQLDLTWKHFRGFSMSFHCATFTASQTNRSGFNSSIVAILNLPF